MEKFFYGNNVKQLVHKAILTKMCLQEALFVLGLVRLSLVQLLLCLHVTIRPE